MTLGHIITKPSRHLFYALTAWALTMAAISAIAQDGPPPFKNPALPVDARVSDLIGRMTVEEKARQLDMYFGCQGVLPTDQFTARTHANPNAVMDAQMAEKNLGSTGVGSIHDLYPRAALYNRL